MTDVLPAGVALVGPPTVTEVNPSVTPLLATFNPSIGPSGAILWNGTLTPNAVVRVDFQVRLRQCVDILVNRAVVRIPSGPQAFAEVRRRWNVSPWSRRSSYASASRSHRRRRRHRRRSVARHDRRLLPHPEQQRRPHPHCSHQRQSAQRRGGGQRQRQFGRRFHRGRLHRRLGRSTRPGYVTGDDQDRSQD
ncbi:MAG: hypothetical protein R2873_11335 [Caldilineaceae bacterium]